MSFDQAHHDVAPSSESLRPSVTVKTRVSRSGAWPASAWTGSAEGAAPGGFQRAADRFTVTGSGDIAPAIPGPGNTDVGHQPIGFFLVGAVAGLIAVIVVATMFMTAEYRRGLIRTTLAVSPVRGRVLAAKTIVIGAAAFLTGLVAAAGTVIVVTETAHAVGYWSKTAAAGPVLARPDQALGQQRQFIAAGPDRGGGECLLAGEQRVARPGAQGSEGSEL
jgi:hypothetical protein